jgi:hypothetical protein
MGLLLLWVTAVAAQGEPAPAFMTGTVSDVSGGVLPGVSVTASSTALGAPVSTVTDASGRYDLGPLPAGSYDVVFALEGFHGGPPARVFLGAGGRAVLDRTLELGGISETVTIVGHAPPQPPPPAKPRVIPPLQPIPGHAPFSVCGPRQADGTGAPAATIVGHPDDPRRRLLGDRDVLVLDAGGASGLRVGQNFVVRRPYGVPGDEVSGLGPSAEHTAGLIQAVAVEERMSLARVVYMCDEIVVGDHVAVFEAEHHARPAGATPDFARPARVLFADAGRTLGAPADLMVIDSGRNQGIHAGQRLTFFRPSAEPSWPAVIGEGIVVAVQADSATIRIESARDTIEIGDAVALYR